MAYNYDVREISGISPWLQLASLTEEYFEIDLSELIVRCDPDISSNFFTLKCKVVKIFLTKKNDRIFQAIFQVP